jgi:hypothetical protein
MLINKAVAEAQNQFILFVANPMINKMRTNAIPLSFACFSLIFAGKKWK